MKNTPALLATLGSVFALHSAFATPPKDPRPIHYALEKIQVPTKCGAKVYEKSSGAYSALPKYAAAIKTALAADPKWKALGPKVKTAIADSRSADLIDDFLKSPNIQAESVTFVVEKMIVYQSRVGLNGESETRYNLRIQVLKKGTPAGAEWWERPTTPDEYGGKVKYVSNGFSWGPDAFSGSDRTVFGIEKMSQTELTDAVADAFAEIAKYSPNYRIPGAEFDCAGFKVPASSMHDMKPNACLGLSNETAIVSGSDKDGELVIRAISVADGSIAGELNEKVVQNRTDLAKYATRNGCGMGLLTSRIVEPNHALLIYTSLTVIDWKFGANSSLAVLSSDYKPNVAYACIGNDTGIHAGEKDISLDAAARTITVSSPRGSKTVNY